MGRTSVARAFRMACTPPKDRNGPNEASEAIEVMSEQENPSNRFTSSRFCVAVIVCFPAFVNR